MKKDQIDIIISCYNSAQFVEECLNSIIRQTYNNYTINIVDDNSSDNTIDIISNFIDNHKEKEINLIRNTTERGPTFSRQIAIDSCIGEYFLILDPDDLIEESFLKRTCEMLKAFPDKSFCYTNTLLFGSANGAWNQPSYNFSELLKGNYICYCSLIKRADFDFCGGFDLNNFGYYEDYENWINMGKNGKYGVHLPEYLFLYRIRENSSINSKRSRLLGNAYKAYIIDKYCELYDEITVNEAKKVLSQYPKNLMSMSIKEQEMMIKEW